MSGEKTCRRRCCTVIGQKELGIRRLFVDKHQSSAMADTLLDLDVSHYDGLYRIGRVQDGVQRVIFVYITDIECIPESSRTSRDELLRELARLDKWYNKCDTLTISESGDMKFNMFKPHGLLKNAITGKYPLFNILDLKVNSVKKSRVRLIQMGSATCYLKIARFEFELTALNHEIRVYIALHERDRTIAPQFIGYAYEGDSDRIIGFILEAVSGKPAYITDLVVCQNAVRKLHRANIIHGDLRRDNILISSEGAKIIDFENARIGPNDGTCDWDELKAEELDHLPIALNDESDVGQPWDSQD